MLLATLGVPALLYLVRPSITPDQIWAMRRFLPAAMPLALLCAGERLLMRATAAARPWVRRPERAAWAGPATVTAVALAGVLMLVSPAATWGRLVVQAEYAGRAAGLRFCDAVRGSRVVVVRGAEPPLLPTLRIVCDVDVVEVAAPADTDRVGQQPRLGDPAECWWSAA